MKLLRGLFDGRIIWAEVEGERALVRSAMAGERTGEELPLSGIRPLAPAEPTKIVCVGRNYLDHIKEMGNLVGGDLPKEPGIFLKGPNALAASDEVVAYPDWTESFHFEGELAMVIGTRAQHLIPENALSHVAGYTCGLDLTARDKQKSDLQWFRAKAADRFCPLGPVLETELDPGDLRVQTRVNGETRQDGRTSMMIFDPVSILTYITRFVTLEVGDVVLTGTPEGVGPLSRGDRVEVEVEGIGTLVTLIG
ncbi:fumarylacetoacetate hydrolase family protein [Deinococcus peraridilitoris]|uniref:2-keto-4-pentenoate hydratase/2-oxohepta-3-ene-1,7-dioic acid hydratase n=1 Tax=Deinococcus peraridilitoris (strain DSM 19664 / LMG 22246 / CIP 109416 / KR-200) TaxID=937777 RepID=L0A841_DEIPD|nr:fumarylacetoacetate hydrolase family protein [Deinococcus peraridilitoris]AFZ69225.1 2-keto-4-pentenoate hydratase/2-oxohepta-3-ene-1,7-dioic acid hydratase [Deinococcus peraridilitoris DSM 19664]